MKKLRLLLLLIFMGCTAKPPVSAIKILLINNNRALKISGLDNVILNDIARDTSNHFDNLVPVYRMPADTDMKDYQPTQPGKYVVKDSALLFTPDTPFVKQQFYFVRYYQYGGGSTIWDFVKKRKTAKSLPYTDLIFKP